jgi:ribosomal protein S18 acetylase RimI-like enzyme
MEIIRFAEKKDCARIAELHLKALPQDLLPSLGIEFLKFVYYPAVIESSFSKVFVLEKDGVPVSFVVFATDTSELAKIIKEDKLSILTAIIKKSFTNPRIPLNILGFILGKVFWEETIQDTFHMPELYSIVTEPSEQSKGYGKLITLKGLESLSRLNGKTGCIVKTSSDGAFRFYQRIGFRKVGYEKRGKNILNILYYEFQK